MRSQEVRARLDPWPAWARRCGVPESVGLSKKVGKRKGVIVRASELGIGNASIE